MDFPLQDAGLAKLWSPDLHTPALLTEHHAPLLRKSNDLQRLQQSASVLSGSRGALTIVLGVIVSVIVVPWLCQDR
jgi:hypothetical protein